MNTEFNRLKKGVLKVSNIDISIPIYFGILAKENGVFSVDLYIDNSFDLNSLIADNHKYLSESFCIYSHTVDNRKVEIDSLNIIDIIPYLSMLKLVCNGKIISYEHKFHKIKNPLNQLHINDARMFYIEVEGLKIEFFSGTETRKNNRDIDSTKWEWDYTFANLSIDKYIINQTFYKKEKSDNIIIEFPGETNKTLTYNDFVRIRDSYISALSLINGAEVKIRKECRGTFYPIEKNDFEVILIYSFPCIKNSKYSTYIPINSKFHKTENILSVFLTSNFKRYIEWNNKIDLNSIIIHLNNSNQTQSLAESFFIKMIAFERLSTLYVKHIGIKNETILDDFRPLKNDLYDIIEKYKNKFDANDFDIMRSKVGGLNHRNTGSTKEKMYKVIKDVDIDINSNIQNLINKKNAIIHEGDIGDYNETLISYNLLDELLREIILRLIKYEGQRNSRLLLQQKKKN